MDREATCVREGIRHTECEECGNVLKTETLDKLPHSYVDRVCENCGALDYSKGLEFKSNYNGTYTLTGIGTCIKDKHTPRSHRGNKGHISGQKGYWFFEAFMEQKQSDESPRKTLAISQKTVHQIRCSVNLRQ